jgi:hypothetical protein
MPSTARRAAMSSRSNWLIVAHGWPDYGAAARNSRPSRPKVQADHDANRRWRAEWEAEHGRKLGGRKPAPLAPDRLAKKSINTTDPDSRVIVRAGKPAVQGYNAQAVAGAVGTGFKSRDEDEDHVADRLARYPRLIVFVAGIDRHGSAIGPMAVEPQPRLLVDDGDEPGETPDFARHTVLQFEAFHNGFEAARSPGGHQLCCAGSVVPTPPQRGFFGEAEAVGSGDCVHLLRGQPRFPVVDNGCAHVTKRAVEAVKQFQGEKFGHGCRGYGVDLGLLQMPMVGMFLLGRARKRDAGMAATSVRGWP